MKQVALRDRDAAVRLASVQALAQLGTPAAMAFIEKTLEPALWQLAPEQGGLAARATSEEPLFGDDE